MKIVVLAGGISTERDVSLCSGRNIYEALKGNGHDVVLVDLFLGLPEEKEPLDHLFTDDRDWSATIYIIVFCCICRFTCSLVQKSRRKGIVIFP